MVVYGSYPSQTGSGTLYLSENKVGSLVPSDWFKAESCKPQEWLLLHLRVGITITMLSKVVLFNHVIYCRESLWFGINRLANINLKECSFLFTKKYDTYLILSYSNFFSSYTIVFFTILNKLLERNYYFSYYFSSIVSNNVSNLNSLNSVDVTLILWIMAFLNFPVQSARVKQGFFYRKGR